ncbi:hypothetical protein [Streptomyces regalis]|uniref:Uncharacterized protein n=1 Tax=Streptomyces regalis TaxID=68262 RepID=A0A101J636_9ACTN|nr:hypothetical protein [Streptomyces regalis]KUL20879.1 hypothetical protein ADL12_47460 [Streptomyces regalis]
MPMDQHDDQRNGPFEDRLSTALHTTGNDFDTDRTALAARGTARGRRLRARRHAAVVGGAAAVAVACVSGALLVTNGGAADAKPTTSSVAASGNRTASATPSGVTAEQMISTLKSLLPEGEVSKEDGRGTEQPMIPPYASLVFDDGEGAAAISIALDRLEPGGEDARLNGECPDKRLANYDDCSVQRLPGGSVFRVVQGYEYPDRREETKSWHAELVTAKGQHVTVSEWNAPAEKGEPVSRPEPPLSPAQLKTFVTAEEWLALVDAMPEDDKKTQPTPGEDASDVGGGRRTVGMLVKMLPKNLEVVDKRAQDSQYAYVVVDDGKGESFLQINVQPDMSDVRNDLFDSDDETLSDGTRVATRQGPGEKGGEGVVMWTVDTMRPDGRRVVVSAFNSGSQVTPATRETPALTMDQLREIALNPAWEAIG